MAETQTSHNQNPGTAHAQALAANIKEAANPKKVEARVFRSNMLTLRYVFKAGKVAAFLTKNGIDSEYVTDIAHEIAELDAEIENNHPNIFSKPAEIVRKIEPVEALKARHFEEFKKLMEAQNGRKGDGGFSEQGKLNVANSDTIADGAASSDGSAAAPTSLAPVGGIKISLGGAAKQ